MISSIVRSFFLSDQQYDDEENKKNDQYLIERKLIMTYRIDRNVLDWSSEVVRLITSQ